MPARYTCLGNESSLKAMTPKNPRGPLYLLKVASTMPPLHVDSSPLNLGEPRQKCYSVTVEASTRLSWDVSLGPSCHAVRKAKLAYTERLQVGAPAVDPADSQRPPPDL